MEDSARTGLRPVLRLHPSIGVSGNADAITDWICKGGEIEAIVDAPWQAADHDFLARLGAASEGRVRALLVPTRLHGIVALAESLPEPLANAAELYFPFSDGPNSDFLSCDEARAERRRAKRERPDLPLPPSRAFDRPVDGLPAWFESEPEGEPVLQSASLNPEPELSIVIPSLNRKESLINTLRHLQRQDLNANLFEVIIVDDGSEDGTLARIREHLMRSPMRFNLRYFVLPRPYPRRRGDALSRTGIARNFGVKKSRGRTLVFLGSDVLVPHDFLSDARAQHAKVDVLQYERMPIPFRKSSQRPRYQDLDPRRDGDRSENRDWDRAHAELEWAALPMHWKYVSASCLIVRREHFDAVGGFARSFRSYGMEDMFLGWQLARLGLRWRMRRKPVYHLRSSDADAEHANSRLRRQIAMTRSARTFYLLTLDEGFYRAFFPLLGRYTRLRLLMHLAKRSAVGRVLLRPLRKIRRSHRPHAPIAGEPADKGGER